MKLSTFLTIDLETILGEWELFARTLFPASAVPLKHILRDHAKEILQAIARDIETPQTTQEQTQKSQGLLAQDADRKSPASIHGELRHISGFTLLQLTSEYRALRATVFRLWMPHMEPFTSQVASEMMRFNEAMDQALAESVDTFSASADRTRDTFLAMLGHDLRSPLFVMTMAGSYLTRPSIGTEDTRQMGARVTLSTANMTSMINELLEYARTQLGGSIPLTLRLENLGVICQRALDEAQAGHPQCPFVLEAQGDLSGSFDAARYRADSLPVTMTRPRARRPRSRSACATMAR